jgi:hypothetical protein
MKYLSNLDLNKNQLLKARLENLASAPSSPVTGQIYYNTSLDSAFIWGGETKGWLSAAGATVVGGNLLSVTIDGQEFTVDHDSVTRTDTTSAASPQPDGTVDVIDSITTSAEGHITAVNVKTITLPSYATSAVDVTGVANIRLTDTDGVEDDIAIVGGSQIDVTVTDASTITIAHADTSTEDSITGLVTTEIFDGITIDGNGHVTGLSTRNLTTEDIGALDRGNLTVVNSTISSTDATITINPASTDTTGTVVIAGDLRVDGTTTTVNSTTIELGDNIIVLNGGEDGAPSANAGFEIERGNEDNVSFLWNETNDRFEITDANATYVVGRKFVHTIGTADLSGATATVTHNLNTKDVFVSLREVASDEIVYATYDAATANTLQIKFASAPADGAYIVTIIG